MVIETLVILTQMHEHDVAIFSTDSNTETSVIFFTEAVSTLFALILPSCFSLQSWHLHDEHSLDVEKSEKKYK